MSEYKHTHSPYGAWELKARYQQHLMLAWLFTVLLVAAIVSAFGLALYLTHAAVNEVEGTDKKPPPPDSIVIELTSTDGVTVVPDEPLVGSRRTSNPNIEMPSNIVPVEDQIWDRLDRTETDIGSFGDYSDYGPEGSDEEGDIFDGSGGWREGLADRPHPDSFVSLERYPEMIYEHKPDYPRLAKRAGQEGEVIIKALINEHGKVIDALVKVSSGIGGLDEAAVQAAYRNRFTPGIQNDRPVKVWVSYKVTFKLEEAER